MPAVEFQLFLSLIIGFRFNCFGDPVSLSTRGDAEIPGCWLQAVLAHMLLSATCWKVNKSMALLAERDCVSIGRTVKAKPQIDVCVQLDQSTSTGLECVPVSNVQSNLPSIFHPTSSLLTSHESSTWWSLCEHLWRSYYIWFMDLVKLFSFFPNRAIFRSDRIYCSVVIVPQLLLV